MRGLEPILEILPPEYARAASLLDTARLEELRLRVGQAPTALLGGCEQILPVCSGYGLVTPEDLQHCLLSSTGQSCYSASETLREGFLTLPGGHRLGVCGTLLFKDGMAVGMKEVSSISIRVARQISCASPALVDALTQPTLMIGAPGCGKTTLLRECVRALSDRGTRISLVDERGELAACLHGVPQLQVGSHTDILCGCKKSVGILQLLRTMNPQWIAVDEITAPEDVTAIEQCGYCGVNLLATAHATSYGELQQRPLYKKLLELRLFHQLFVLDDQKTVHVERMK